jgi:hypothetical protein
MPQVGFELTITLFERTKTFLALDRTVTMNYSCLPQIQVPRMERRDITHLFFYLAPQDGAGIV